MSNSKIVERWAEQVGSDHARYLHERKANVIAEGRSIYSYGRHFEMARLVGDRKTGYFLVNGDRVSNTTSQHQSIVRNAIRKTGLPSIIIPYSALDAARIERDTIRLLDVRPDRWVSETVHVGAFAELPKSLRVIGYGADGYGDGGRGILLATRDAHVDRAVAVVGPLVLEYDERTATEDEALAGVLAHRPIGRDENGWWYTRGTHFLGDSLFTAEVHVEVHASPSPSTVAVRIAHMEANVRKCYDYSIHEFDHYFAGPDSDIFHGPLRRETHEALLDRANAPVVTRTRRRRTFVSSFDYQERTPLYFLAEVPPAAKPRTVADAILALSPRAVHAALARGRDVVRQGDIFAIATSYTTADLKARGAVFAKRSNRLRERRGRFTVQDVLSPYGTAHTATEVARIGNAWYMRGIMYHDPLVAGEVRDRDHDRRPLGDRKTWYLAVRNTVPRQNFLIRARNPR